MLLTFASLVRAEKEPQFQANILAKNQNISKFLEFYNRDVEIKTERSGQFRPDEYFYCSITVSDAKFENNFAFGSSVSSASGGALYCSHSQLSIVATSVDATNKAFITNQAAIGGAFAALGGKAFINKYTFTNNTAQKFGGAIYFQGIPVDRKIPDDNFIVIEETTFESNKATDVGGAVCCSNVHNAYADNCTFKQNKADIAGGAIYFMETPAKIASTTFESNEVNTNDKVLNNGNAKINGQNVFNSINYTRFASRGGGAIYFTAIESQKVNLETTKCCFKQNKVTGGYIFAKGNPGDNVLLDCRRDYQVEYFSNQDGITKTKVSSNKEHQILYTFKDGKVDNCDISSDEAGTVKDPTKAPRKNNAEEKTGDVPLPTTFTYHATAITKLPQATSSSFVTFPTTKSLSFPNPEKPGTAELPKDVIPPRTHAPLIQGDPNKKGRYTSGTVSSLVIIQTYTSIKTTRLSYDQDNNPHYVETEIEGVFDVPSYTQVFTRFYIEDAPPQKKNQNMLPIIIGVVAGLILLIAAALVIYFVACKKKDEDSNSTVEMAEETVTAAPSTSNTITNDNPLWTTSVVGDDDDPFKRDFEEEGVEGFFDVKHNDVIE